MCIVKEFNKQPDIDNESNSNKGVLAIKHKHKYIFKDMRLKINIKDLPRKKPRITI